MKNTNQRCQSGYILALNIAVLALMLLVATYMGQRMSLARKMAAAEAERVSAEYQLQSARADVLLLLATLPRTHSGLGELATNISLDGRFYTLNEDIDVSFQDIRGLIPLNEEDQHSDGGGKLQRLLSSYGLDPVTTAKLSDSLLDYRDADNLKRLNGAEKEEYERIGAQIRNSNLLTATELVRVIHWSEAKELWKDDPITNHVCVQKTIGFNPNVAGWRALSAMSGVSEEVAKKIIEDRRLGTVPDASGLLFLSEKNGNPFGSGLFINRLASATVVVTLRKTKMPWGYRLIVTHTPTSEQAPWRVESDERVSLPIVFGQVPKRNLLPLIKRVTSSE